jgi:CO/xanthine dehydrogenase Mo-binding subunit
MTELKRVGKPTRRVDALEKVLGTARFTHDLKLPGMLVAKVLRSPAPHAEIVKLDVTPALKVPGVAAAITSEDYVDHSNWGFPVKDDYMLAYGRVRYVGDPIAAVAAESEDAALAGLEAIVLELRELPAVFDVHTALEPDAPLLHPELAGEPAEKTEPAEDPQYIEVQAQGNLSETLIVRQGEPLSALERCDIVVDEHYSVAHQEHAYLETEAALAAPTPDGGVTIYLGDQSPFITLGNLTSTLGLPATKVRVVQTKYIGGSFGGKSDNMYECAGQAAKLALKCGRPVKIVLDREESMIASYKRDAMMMHYRLGADADGTIRAAKIDCWSDSGAYASMTPFTGWRASVHAMGPYRYSDCHVDLRGVYTNNGYSGAFRGFGSTEVQAVSEQAVDELAEKCGIDPLEFRLKNCIRLGDTLPYGQTLEESVGLDACLERVRELSDWDRKRAEYAGQPANAEIRRGIGVGCFFHGCSLGAEGADDATHIIQLGSDNSFQIISGLTDYGQGSRTVFCLIAAETMGLPLERFTWGPNDTNVSKDCGPTVASRSTILGGNATRVAAERLLQQIRQTAAIRLHCAEDEVTQSGETFTAPDGRRVSLDEIIQYARNLNIPMSATAQWEMPHIHWSFSEGRGTPYVAYHFGAQVADVEVDTRTGKTKVLHIWAVHDVGKVVFPEGAVGQIIGGIAQGLGYGLLERVDFQNGRLINPNFDTYLIPTAADMPPVTVEFVENELSFGPYGAKNVAEPSMVPTTPAILNAIYQATGTRVRHTPANLERVLLGRDLQDSVVTICRDGACERARCDVGEPSGT